MKRFLGILLATALLCVPALAEEIDVSAMSLDELVALRAKVQSEIDTRIDATGDILPEGRYTVGQGIKAGNYVFTVQSVRELSDGTSVCAIELYDDAGNFVQYSSRIKVGDVFFFGLTDGMTLVIDGGYGTVSLAGQSWAN